MRGSDHRVRRWVVAGVVVMLAAPAVAGSDAAFAPTACPSSVVEFADCHVAQDDNGAWLLAAVPHDWNRRLVVHAHGGPRLGQPQAGDSAEDLDRFAAMVHAGYAWIGTSYRRGGYGVRMAAEDADNGRQAFWSRWGRPERTFLHGQSWGGNVAAKAAELYALDSEDRPNYDAILTTNGVLFGGTRAYGHRADLRAVYQYYCNNHPAPDEPQYPVWQGLPTDAQMDRDELRRRVDACTGLGSTPDARTPGQVARLHDILAVTGLDESQLFSNLSWATFLFQDMVQRRLGGRNPFDNSRAVYLGSLDDEALNAGVERFAADPDALARLAYDADLSGLIVVPTLTVHALHDPVVSFGAEAAYAATVQAAGRGHLLAQVAIDEHDHSRPGQTAYMGALHALETWLNTGTRPDAAAMQQSCLAGTRDPSQCRFVAP